MSSLAREALFIGIDDVITIIIILGSDFQLIFCYYNQYFDCAIFVCNLGKRIFQFKKKLKMGKWIYSIDSFTIKNRK